MIANRSVLADGNQPGAGVRLIGAAKADPAVFNAACPAVNQEGQAVWQGSTNIAAMLLGMPPVRRCSSTRVPQHRGAEWENWSRIPPRGGVFPGPSGRCPPCGWRAPRQAVEEAAGIRWLVREKARPRALERLGGSEPLY